MKFTDGVDENLASVTPLPADSDLWILAMDLQDTANIDELHRTLVHEFAHVVTLAATQVPRNDDVLNNPNDEDLFLQAEEACPQFFTGEGCSIPQSYINQFFGRYWTGIYEESFDLEPEGLFDIYPDQFVSSYASTNPGEDIAESWTAFVLDPRPTGNRIADQKVLFFYDFPELVALREQILGNLGRDVGDDRGGDAPQTEATAPTPRTEATAAAPPGERPVSGAIVEQACSAPFDVSPTEASASFTIDGSVAVMRGVIDGRTPDRVEDLLNDNPGVHTIVLAYVPGSDDDEANLDAALLIRDANLATCVPSGGEIASGGTDFFLAGVVRRAADDTFIGVHSWAADDFEGGELPRDDPEHDSYLFFYEDIGVNPDFYWFTLQAAPADGMHNMTRNERQRWGIETP